MPDEEMVEMEVTSVPERLKGDVLLDMVAHWISRGTLITSSRNAEFLQSYMNERETPMKINEYLDNGGVLW